MQFTKQERHAQRDYVDVLRYQLEAVANQLNEKYREHAEVAHKLALAQNKLNQMED